MSAKDPESHSLHPDKHIHVIPRSRGTFILKSLSIILTLTVVVLGINYYLISNCPSETQSSQEPNAISPRISEPLAKSSINRVTVTVYYEILCPDSKSFIIHQLGPVQKRLGKWINVRFVPFGKASYSGSDDDLHFTGQHGPEEVYGNKLHSCIVHTHPQDQDLQTEIIVCSMDNYRLWGTTIESITQVTKDCRQKYAPQDASPLLCNNASLLLKRHGAETLGLKPPVTFIPTIAIDGSLMNQRQLLRDLNTVVCKHVKSKNPDSTNPC